MRQPSRINRLFSKLWMIFLLTQLVFMVLVLTAAGAYLRHIQDQFVTPQQHILRLLSLAEQEMHQGGVPALLQWLKKTDKEELVPILLVDDNNVDILGRAISPRTVDFISKHPQLMQEGGETPRPTILVADGVGYRFFYDYPQATIERFLSRPKVIGVPLALALMLAALVSWLLAKYLASPIEHLRNAMRRFSEDQPYAPVLPKLQGRQDELAELAWDMDAMVRQWEQLLASQQRLLRDVSHDLRSPLSRARLALSLIPEPDLGQQQAIKRVENELEKLAALIARLLHLAKHESGVEKIPRKSFNWWYLLDTLIEETRFALAAKSSDIRLDINVPQALKQGLMNYVGAESSWHSALDNVLRNAERFTPEHEVLSVRVRACVEHQEPWVLLTIEDRGCGVAPAMLPRLFEPFFRLGDRAQDEDIAGAMAHDGHDGLGLAIAKRAIEFHGGSIRAYNLGDGVEKGDRHENSAKVQSQGFAVVIKFPLHHR
jgi:two-component system sensor histidine kinase CpxA